MKTGTCVLAAMLVGLVVAGCDHSTTNTAPAPAPSATPILRIQSPNGLTGVAPFTLRLEGEGTHDPDGGGIRRMSISWGETTLGGLSQEPIDFQTWHWQHTIEEPGTYPLVVVAWDDEGQEARWEEVCVVRAPNQAPTAAADESFVCQRGGLATIEPTVADPDGDALELVVVQEPQHGVLSALSARVGWEFTAEPDWAGWDIFRYKVRDARGAESETVSVHVHIQAPPVCGVWSVEPSDGGLPSTVRAPLEGPVPLRICLVLGDSHDPDGGGFQRFAMVGSGWGVGMEADGGLLQPSITSLTHTFIEAGTYEVAVILVDDEDQQVIETLVVDAHPAADG